MVHSGPSSYADCFMKHRDYLTYALRRDGEYNVLILKRDGSLLPNHVVIPGHHNGQATHLGPHTFYHLPHVESITLEEGVRSIGERNFTGCDNLRMVVLPHSLERIGDYCFVDSYFDNCNHFLDPDCFYYKDHLIRSNKCGEVFVLDGTRTIADGAFDQTNGKPLSVHLPDSIQFISPFSFPQNHECVEIHISPDHPYYEVKSNILVDKRTHCAIYAMNNGFFDSMDEISEIGDYCFLRMRLPIDFVLPKSVKRLGKHAFDGAENVGSFELPSLLESIGESCFRYSDLQDVVIPDSVTKIAGHAFDNTKMRKIFVPATVQKVEYHDTIELEIQRHTKES